VLTPAEQKRLIEFAREAVQRGLHGDHAWTPTQAEVSPALARLGATFVTLRRGETLLGCIGSLEARRSLAEDVVGNAVAAAFADPRLPAVTVEDFPVMAVKVSVLGPLEPLGVASFDQTRSVVHAGDGVLLTHRRHRATFLPSVWEQVPDTDTFLAMLWQKAGLRPREWPRTLEVARYQTLEFGD
jgi:uncharacterized protein